MRRLASIVSLLLVVGIALPAMSQEVGSFEDVPASNPFADDIDWLASEGITRGCNPPQNTLFCPDDPVTRGQMAAFLVRALGLSAEGPTFDDTRGHVFEGDIGRLAEAGITRGCNPPQNTRFCPDDQVTRGQMAAFLVRALGLNAEGDGFDDTQGHVFEGDISRLAEAGITRGCNPPQNTRFCPDDPVTRSQMAAFLRRALESSTPVFEDFDPIVFSGNGDAHIEVSVPNDGPALLDASFEWTGPNEANFVVWSVRSDGLQLPLLVDAAVADTYQGRRSLNTRWHEVNGFYPVRALDVVAPEDGQWTLTIRPMSDAQVFTTGSVSGQGEDVLVYAGSPGALNWTLQNGPTLHVEALTSDGSYPTPLPFLIDSADPSGSAQVPSGTVILDIEADDGGSWTLSTP